MASKNPGKQRRTSSKAAMHVQRKRLRARLVSDDPQLQMIRTVTVRAGDEVEVLRGDFGNPNSVKKDSRGKRLGQSRGRAGIKANVARVDTNKGMIYVDGLTISTSDGKEEGVPIRPSNLVVTNLYEGDPLRIKRLMERFRRGETDE